MPIETSRRLFTRPHIQSFAPDRPGVYALYRQGRVIYYGMSLVDVRARLFSHNSGAEGLCTQKALMFNTELTAFPQLREQELLREFRLTYGRRPECNDKVG